MVLIPAVLEMFARDVVQDAHPELVCPMLAEAAVAHRRRLMELTGKGVLPGVATNPEFVVQFPTMEQRAEQRRQRRAAREAGNPPVDQAEDESE